MVPPATDKIMDPVECLKGCILRTEMDRKGLVYPLYMPLNAPDKARNADTVGNILQKSIQLAGLSQAYWGNYCSITRNPARDSYENWSVGD